MNEPSLTAAVEAERAKALALEARLSKRRASEAAELEVLESTLSRAQSKKAELEAHLVKVGERNTALEAQAQTLEHGLSRGSRWWARLGEPVIGALSLFLAIVSVGLTRTPQVTVILEGVALAVGASVSGLARTWSRRA
jgi:chromosome segregation ATPase